jgi:hypothetical protein
MWIGLAFLGENPSTWVDCRSNILSFCSRTRRYGTELIHMQASLSRAKDDNVRCPMGSHIALTMFQFPRRPIDRTIIADKALARAYGHRSFFQVQYLQDCRRCCRSKRAHTPRREPKCTLVRNQLIDPDAKDHAQQGWHGQLDHLKS